MIHNDDAVLNTASDPSFADVADRRFSRRSALVGGAAGLAAFVAGSALGGSPVAADGHGGGWPGGGRPGGGRDLLGFAPVPLGYSDQIVVPTGYSSRPFLPWGTPTLGSFPAFVPGGNSAADQAQQIGMHHDGMHYFPLGLGPEADRRGLLAVNHEYTDEALLHTGVRQSPAWLADKASWTPEMVLRSQNAHGVSVTEVARARSGEWQVVRSRRNRRITATTSMRFSGPAKGHRLVRTAADPSGSSPKGTFNNCANGWTPWGTYLTCEENFNGYFRVDPGAYDAEQAALTARYGVGGDRNNWATHDPRFVITPAAPHEANRHGWVVEIDPYDPRSTPVKRTALGRLKHEGVAITEGRGGRIVAYMGDDQAGEYIYKFVSSGSWRSLRARGKSPLDEGTLYVARFDEDGTGRWLPLVHGSGPLVAANGFADQGDVVVKARLAATAVGATPMDRPEWTSVDPNRGTVYCTLTNNTSTSKVPNAANPRVPNRWGHIVRWDEDRGDHGATSFAWDLFLVAGPGRDAVDADGSSILAEDAFGSPDGLWIDGDSRVWVQTDGSQPTGANDQMVVAHPTATDETGAPQVKRFLTGVLGAEVTGITATPDQRTLFVNIQHPGEAGVGSWPDGGSGPPRSSTVVITKDDGGVIGT